MKNVYKSFALLCVGLATVACMDEPFEDVVLDTTPGNDIVFTAVAANDDLTTKTVYGAPGDGIVPLLWKHGDNIQIASPEAIGENNAEYTIGTQDKADNQNAYSVTKSGDGGLQWSEEDTYHFYAMYPSPATLSNTGVYLDHDKMEMMGLIPMNQQPSNTPVLINGGYTLEPDMRYAYMVAKDTYTRNASGDNVTLAFTPMVTTLQFDITANSIGTQAHDGGQSRLFLTGVSLLSKDKMDETGQTVLAEGKSISGNFTYNFDSDNITIEGNNRINMNFAGTGYELTEKQYCNVTFFLLPQNYPAGTLELQLLFTVGGTTQIRKTTIAIDIQKQKKYVFNDLLMPVIDPDVTGSSWISGLDPQMKISQLSLPVAGNTFANRTYDKNNVSEYTQQQSLTYEQLWNMGVRGFEFVNQSSGSSTTPALGLGNQKPVCYETVLSAANVPTFATAFQTLVSFFVRPEYAGEFLLLICTYQAANDGYNPDRYVKELLTYFDYFIQNSETLVGKQFTQADFVKLTSQTTIAELQGNIAVVIRPGDDDRYQSGAGNSDKLTSSISLLSSDGTDWTENVSLIADWGTAFDVWDRRYEEKVGDERKEVARESTFETNYYHQKGRPIVEHWLYGQSATGSTTYSALSGSDSYGYDAPTLHKRYNNFNNFNNYEEDPDGSKDIKTELVLREGGFNYEHSIVGGGVAYIQEWSRVIPATLNNVVIDTKLEGDRARLFVKWPESITEKKNAIDGLFMKSVSRLQNVTTNDIYINSLSGYYATTNHMQSLLPFQQWFGGLVEEEGWLIKRHTNMVTNQGKGGDSIGLADELNAYVYGILSGRTEMSVGGKLDKGPWGLIIMDHIQPAGISAELVKLIMMNNFEVESGGSGSDGSDNEDDPEDETTTPSEAWVGDYDSVYLDGENAISFE